MRVYIFDKYITDENIRLEFRNITKNCEKNGLTYNERLVEQEKFVREHGKEVTSLDIIKKYPNICQASDVKNIFCYGTSKNILDDMVRGIFGCKTNNYGSLSYLTMHKYSPDEINSEDSEAVCEYSFMKEYAENMRYFIQDLWSEIANGNIVMTAEK
jgi:hypothetical protein